MPFANNDPWDLCEDSDPEDGISPNEVCQQDRRVRERRRRDGARHRSLQYAKQAQHAIDASLSCDVGDPSLRDLVLLEVRPVQGCSLLEVILTSSESDVRALQACHDRLAAIEGILRAAVAAATHRKRVARLRFTVLPQHQA